MKLNNNNIINQAGVSFVEIIIYLSITVTILTLTTSLLIRSVKTQSSSATYKELTQTNQVVLEKMEYAIRHAKEADTLSNTMLKLTSNDYTKNKQTYTFFENKDGMIYQADSENDKILLLNWQNITPDNIQIDELNFEKIDETIKIDLTTKKGEAKQQTSATYYPRQPLAFCGDGLVNQTVEKCDDGNKNNIDDCSNSCLINTENPTPVKTCSGEGELYLYDRQGGPIDINFTVQRNQLLIFSRLEANLTAKINGQTKQLKEEIRDTDEFGVKVMSLKTTPGDKVEISGSYVNGKHPNKEHANGSRGVQAFLAQDVDDPVYNLSTIGVVYDGLESDQMKLDPGEYSYILFDRYSFNNDGSIDNRRTSINIFGNGNTVVDKDYFKPLPSNFEGVIVDYYTIDQIGTYTLNIDTEDSMYWFSSVCPL